MEEPIKGYEDGQCHTCGEFITFTVLLYPKRSVKMGECRRGHWNQTEEILERG